jgi:hypothetical protein
MIGVVDLETAKTEDQPTGKTVKDTWLLRLPKDICDKEGFAEGTLVSVTIKDGGIQSTFIRPPSKKIQEISRKFIEDDRELHRRLKEIGD